MALSYYTALSLNCGTEAGLIAFLTAVDPFQAEDMPEDDPMPGHQLGWPYSDHYESGIYPTVQAVTSALTGSVWSVSFPD
jgi:hypothetical protein